MPGLHVGDLDREIVIQTAPVVQSASGEERFDWDAAESTTVWAEWMPGGTTETYRAQQRLGSYIDGVFRIYECDPVPTPNDTRIVFDGRNYDIKPPYEDMTFPNALLIPVVARGE